MNFRAFPVAMGRYFEWALKDLGHEVTVAGYTMGDEVPWPNGPHHFPEYNFPPEIRLPNVEEYPLERVLERFKGLPDLILQAGDTCYLTGKAPAGIPNVILATDPHCIDYTPRLANATHFASMQDYYGRTYNRPYFWVPYAYYPPIHKKLPDVPKVYDIVFCGLPYKEREDFLQRAKEDLDLKVFSKLGVIFNEYTKVYNQGIIAFNHSSRLDLPARFWEGLAMGNLVLTNYVPELDVIEEIFGFHPDIHYVAYSTIDEALEKAQYYIEHPAEASKIAEAGYRKVQGHTYQARAKELLWKITGR